jgi:signal transduction histidine kinase
MTPFSSLTNRIFFAASILAVLSISVAIYIVNRAVSTQAVAELQRGIGESAALVDEYRNFNFDSFGRTARLIADIPQLKAAVDTHDPATVEPLAREYQSQFPTADLFAIADNQGKVLVRLGAVDVPDALLASAVRSDSDAATEERETFWAGREGILLVKSVPIFVDRRQPDVLGTLILGATLDNRQANRFKGMTNSDMAFGMDGRILAATLPKETWPALATLLDKPGLSTRIQLGNEAYLAFARPLAPASTTGRPMEVVLRSQSERLRFLTRLHTLLAATAVLAVLVAILVSYGIARTITRPLGTITSTMREMAASGDLSRRIPTQGARWQDEDARLLATTFNSMTDSIERFQREAAQRERLSSLGRLSTVIAHEIRNPLMIIKTSLRSLRREDARPEQLQAAARDIDEEITRLNRIVAEVLDYARPIKFERHPTDLNALTSDAVKAAEAAAGVTGIRVVLDAALPNVVTDAGRLRQALVNIVGNAVQAMEAKPEGARGIRVRTMRLDSRLAAITVSDSGEGIPAADLPRVFDPYFTTRRTGTGIGLAISRNIIEGLGGRITVASEAGRGTDVRIELPVDAPGA